MQQKVLFEPRILIINVINLIVLAFWIKFSFFYKSKGVLDIGVWENYWEVSFKSLLLFFFGTNASWIQSLLITIFTLVVLFTFFRFIKKPITNNKIFEQGFFCVIVLLLHIIAFYLLKKGLKVNYPEDRTGLFFYVFFVLTLVFFFDVLPKFISATTAALLGVSSLCYFTLSFNLSSFTHYFYHVIPKEFYSFLQKEYKNEKQVFTTEILLELNANDKVQVWAQASVSGAVIDYIPVGGTGPNNYPAAPGIITNMYKLR
jgi:multisubunit Na+/H+ antiporter MnhF subunit